MEGHVAVVGVSRGLWLGPDDFIGLGSSLQLSFPKDWPAVYGSKELKALIGKKGRLPAKRVAVAGEALLEDWKLLEKVKVYPLQSFSNALRIAEADRSLEVVKGWIVWECLDQFVAQRYWWNSKGDRWIDLSPRPLGVTQLLLVQAEGSHKEPELLRKEQADFAARLLAQFRGSPELRVAIDEKQEVAKKPAKSLDYSKWSNIVDSDDEDVHLDEDVGVKDLLEGAKAKKEPPLPDYLLGSTNGGGGTNCLTSLLKMLDSEQSQENAHQLAQVFGRSFHTAMLDQARQDFYRQALELLPPETFVVVLGLGSALPLLRAARRFQGVFLESSAALHRLGDELLRRHGLHGFAKATVALDDAAALAQVLRPLEKPTAVAVLTERMAHDLLSNGLVPCCLAAHQAVQEAWGLTARHIPQTVELLASPAEIRSDRLKELDIRPFNALRHTSSNDKADFWWWPVRMDNQPNTICSLLGPAKTLCGFDFDRSLDIGLEEVRRPLKLRATQRGRVNCAALWWLAKFEGLEYSTRPKLKDSKDSKDSYVRSEWKQAIHYLAGETSVFPGDVIELLVSITPRFTFRMMQQSPMAVEAPLWVQAPCSKRFSATLPILPYHFLMLTDTERLERYQEALIKTIGRLSARLKRRVRVLDAGCGIGLLGLSAALQGAEVYLCEAKSWHSNTLEKWMEIRWKSEIPSKVSREKNMFSMDIPCFPSGKKGDLHAGAAFDAPRLQGGGGRQCGAGGRETGRLWREGDAENVVGPLNKSIFH